VLVCVHEAGGERLGQAVEADELLDALLQLVILLRAPVQPQHDVAHVTKDGGIHQRYNNIMLHFTYITVSIMAFCKYLSTFCGTQLLSTNSLHY
jgi:hypothetical protein